MFESKALESKRDIVTWECNSLTAETRRDDACEAVCHDIVTNW